MSESGTTTPGIAVAHALRRNTNTTRMTSAIETRSVSSTSRMELRIVMVRSSITVRSIAAGIEARSCGRRGRTRAALAVMLGAGCREVEVGDAGRAVAGAAGG